MNVRFAYSGRSALLGEGGPGQTLQLEPNLAREPVAFDAPLLRPLRFREAISALHDVVVSDLRFKRRDKTAYHAWKQDQLKLDHAGHRPRPVGGAMPGVLFGRRSLGVVRGRGPGRHHAALRRGDAFPKPGRRSAYKSSVQATSPQ